MKNPIVTIKMQNPELAPIEIELYPEVAPNTDPIGGTYMSDFNLLK